MGQQYANLEKEQKRKQDPAYMAKQQAALQEQLQSQQSLIDQMQAQYEAQLKAAQAGLSGEYGPIAQASTQNADGSWSRPQYQTLLDPETGLLRDNFQLQDNLDTSGLNAFKGEALREAGTPSAWLTLAQEGEDQNRLNNLNDLSAQLNSGQRSAMDQLAASGGLDSGSRLSLVRSGLRDSLRGKQDINNQSRQNALGLEQSDEENRINMLSQLPGMQLQTAQYQNDLNAKNIEAAMNERRYAYDNEMNAWNKNQETWAANKQADAQRASSGGCFRGETLITMGDGSKKAIKDVQLGDEVMLGGRVLQLLQGVPEEGDDWYNISGVHVSGSHLILDGGEWVPARSYSDKVREIVPEVYFNLTTKNHLLLINETLFSDLQDVDNYKLDDFEALHQKNITWRVSESA